MTQTVLLKSTENSQLVDGFMANLAGENIMKEFKPSGVEYNLAVRLSGKFKTAFPQGKPADEKPDEKKPDDAGKTDADKKEEQPAGDFLKESAQDNTVDSSVTRTCCSMPWPSGRCRLHSEPCQWP
jgi:hypothetical protein